MSDLTTLARLARENPDAVSADGWQKLGTLGLQKSVVFPQRDDGTPWLRHPSGYLVTGPDTVAIINGATGQATGGWNSAVYACLSAYARYYTEPALRLWRGPYMDIEASEVVDDARAALLRLPSTYWSMSELLTWQVNSVNIAGNAYYLKLRAGDGDVTTNTTGAVTTLLPVPAGRMQPGRAKGSSAPLDYYTLEVPGRNAPLHVPTENVIHVRSTFLADDMVTGIGPVGIVALEVATEDEVNQFTNALLVNLGVPGLTVSPSDSDASRGFDPAAVKSAIDASVGGRNRGRTLVFPRPMSISQLSVTTDVLNLSHIWDHVETRIAAVLRVPAILAGLSAGLDAATYSNAEQLISYFVDAELMNAWRRDSETWTRQLSADLGLRDDEYIAFDWTNVRALQADEDAKWARVINAWTANVLDLGTVYTMLDLGDAPADVATARAADIVNRSENTAGGLFAGGMGVAQPAAPKALEVKAAGGKFEPDTSTLAKPERVKITDADIDTAMADWRKRAAKVAPEFIGLLDATEG